MNIAEKCVPPPQKQWKFVNELKKPQKRYFAWTRTEKRTGEADLSDGIRIINHFADSEILLETAISDLHDFIGESPIRGHASFPIYLQQGASGRYDSFTLKISEDMIIITAENPEGIRRGIFYLEDLLLSSDGPFLACGGIQRKAWLRNRISRCFFGPIKRPPMNRDELMDEEDYYPDAYLNHLAHEGINGLWVTVELQDLCRTEFTPDAAPDAERRIAKLRRTADQCLRYGIRIFLFMIEPKAWNADDPILKKYPELGGASCANGQIAFCPSSETAEKYLYQSTQYIFSRVPQLGGIINISLGERNTTCLSSMSWDVKNKLSEHTMQCPRCRHVPVREVIYKSVAAMTRGMRDASPDAEFISWYYMSAPDMMLDDFFSLTKLPGGATLLINFESGGECVQCGRKLTGGDYWLSYAGPSKRFERMMNGISEGIGRGAKLQVACSHELATVPYIPVPGLLYRKYREMRRLKVSTVMQGWYFGNYPGLMNKAAGMLAFEDFSTDENDFLKRLAAPEWRLHASDLAAIWRLNAEAYQNYPFSNSVQYYGPFHDGIVWPLYPYRRYLPLNPTWRIDFPASGDTIGECLYDLPLKDAEILSGRMSALWHRAAVMAEELKNEYADAPERLADLDLMEALDLLFASAHNIFRFYLLRSEDKGFTQEMHDIMKQEIQHSSRMRELCLKDSRLGFHSEAENYKFFPEKLDARIAFLKKMLEQPLPELIAKVHAVSTRWYQANQYSWRLEDTREALKIHAVFSNRYRIDQFFAAVQGRPETPPIVLGITKDNAPVLLPDGSAMKSGLSGDGWKMEFSIPWRKIDFCNSTFRLAVVRLFVRQNVCEYAPYPDEPDGAVFRFRIGYHLPQYMITFKREKKEKPMRCHIAPIGKSAELGESLERRDHGHKKTTDRQRKARD